MSLFPMFVKLEGRRVLVVGAGSVGEAKIESLLATEASVRVVAPKATSRVREWARDHGHDLADCFGYSDSYSDVPMLSVVGHPCVVNPDLRLHKLARTYAWPVISLGERSRAAQLLERLP